jgi:hypothetical protein
MLNNCLDLVKNKDLIMKTAHQTHGLPFLIRAKIVFPFWLLNTHLAPDLKIELGVGFHILPKSGIWLQKWLLFNPLLEPGDHFNQKSAMKHPRIG